jgi:hypothetical protein
VVVTEEGVSAGHAGVALEGAVVVQTTNNGGSGRIGTRLGGLAADAQQIGDGIAVEKMSSIGCRSCETALHVEALLDSDNHLRGCRNTITRKPLVFEVSTISNHDYAKTHAMVGQGVQTWARTAKISLLGCSERVGSVIDELSPQERRSGGRVRWVDGTKHRRTRTTIDPCSICVTCKLRERLNRRSNGDQRDESDETLSDHSWSAGG